MLQHSNTSVCVAYCLSPPSRSEQICSLEEDVVLHWQAIKNRILSVNRLKPVFSKHFPHPRQIFVPILLGCPNITRTKIFHGWVKSVKWASGTLTGASNWIHSLHVQERSSIGFYAKVMRIPWTEQTVVSLQSYMFSFVQKSHLIAH